MKKNISYTDGTKNKYNAHKEYNKRNYRLEKGTYGAVSESECLRWAAERRYL